MGTDLNDDLFEIVIDASGRLKQILDVGADLFYRKGYEATSTKDIAEMSGLLKGSLYHYVKSKEEILFLVLSAVHGSILRMAEPVFASNESADTRLAHLARRHVEFNTRNSVWTGVFYQDFRSLTGPYRESVLGFRDQYEYRVRTLIIDGQSEGCLRRDIDPKLIAFFVLGAVNSIHRWYRPDLALTPSDIAERFADLVTASVQRQPSCIPGGLRRS